MAQSDTIASILPQNNEPPAATFGTFDTVNTTSPHPVVDLALTEIFIATFLLPRHYAGGGLRIYITYAMSSATEFNIRLTTEIEAIGDAKDLSTDAWATASNTGNVTVPGTAVTDIVTTEHLDGAQMDTAIVGDFCRLRITRIAVTAGSDATGDLEIRGIEIQETPT